MGVYQFNTPRTVILPVTDSVGVTIVAPTPILLEDITGLDVSIEGTLSDIRNGQMYAVGGVRGEHSVTGKLKFASSAARTANLMLFQSAIESSATYDQVYINVTGPMANNSPLNGAALYIYEGGTYTDQGLLLNEDWNFGNDLGAVDQYGGPFTKVASTNIDDSNVASGTYYLGRVAADNMDLAYRFNTDDIFSAGRVPYVSLALERPVAENQTNLILTLNNGLLGQTPTFSLTAYSMFQGRGCVIHCPVVMAESLDLLGLRSNEFSTTEVALRFYPENTLTGKIMTISYLT